MAVLKYSIKAENEGYAKTRVKARNFEFIIDEPKNAGGEDAGPTPVEYLIGALAGCLGVVCNKVAKEMDIKINSLNIDIEGDLDTDKFAGKDTDKRSGYREIIVNIIADVDADSVKKYQWIKAVKERCPVSDNISNQTPVKIKLS